MRREHEARAQVLHRLDGLESLGGIARQRLDRRGNEIGIRPMVRAPDTATQLMQLRKSEAVGAVDHDRVGRGYVDTALDDRGAHKQVEAAVIEVDHQLLEIALAHLAVADAYTRLRNERLDFRGEF